MAALTRTFSDSGHTDMILSGHIEQRWDGDPFVARITSDASRPFTIRGVEGLLISEKVPHPFPIGFKAYFALNKVQAIPANASVIKLPADLSYVQSGDIVAVHPRNSELRVIYRIKSQHNSLMVTPACNSFCLMCSQPPSKTDIEIFRLLWHSIPLMDIDTPGLILSGGEPTLVGSSLVELISRLKCFLPSTGVHLLTNGRRLKFLSFAQDIAAVGHSDLILGIPLYSDVAHEHDYIVQSRGAFDETVCGLLNLARCGIQVELRVVITKQNFDCLPRLGRFISRNFPFVCNVALMGLEPVGLAEANLMDVWIDPADYSMQLTAAVKELKFNRIPVTIYNHQLCTLGPELWSLSRQSISDWKNAFLPECETCHVKHDCCGFFASGLSVHSRAIRPVTTMTSCAESN